jgi:uncharacterized protein with ATP-grasp and redox domains
MRQNHYESLSGEKRNDLYSLFIVKCNVIGEDVGCKKGGELVFKKL